MSNLLQLQNGVKSYGAKVLFEGAQFAINEQEHVGVIGPNGAGKTTLFKILTGEETLDDGLIVKSRSLRLGYLAQHDLWGPNQTVEDYLKQGCRTPIWELKSLGKRLGLTDDLFLKPVTSLSGGYRMRCKLLYLIGQEPNLMLLDEPTNYLDLETVLVLEEFLQGYQGAFLLVSHDREFLRRTTDHILEIEQGEIVKFNGNLDDYFEQKAMLRAQLEARAMSLQEKRQQTLDFVARFGAKATKAKQAQSRLKSLDRMETIELKPLPVSASVRIPSPERVGKVVLQMKNVSLGYGDKTILKNINYILGNGDHCAIVGLNGAGKTTFLKSIAGQLKPQSGSIELGFNVSMGYYAQHVAESLDSNSTVLEQILAKAHPEITTQDGLNMAGSLLFSGESVKKKISVLSGGEKSRVALGQILLQKAPCLVLDEPTNHLDFQTVEALTQALVSYEGTVVVVSHDRSFVRRVGKKIVEINYGQVTLYPGTYDDYTWSLQKGSLAQRSDYTESPEIVTTPVEAPKKEKFNFKEKRKELERQLRQGEKAIEDLESKIANLNEKLIQFNSKISDKKPSKELSDMILEMGKIQKEIEHLESQWLLVTEKKDSLKIELSELLK